MAPTTEPEYILPRDFAKYIEPNLHLYRGFSVIAVWGTTGYRPTTVRHDYVSDDDKKLNEDKRIVNKLLEKTVNR